MTVRRPWALGDGVVGGQPSHQNNKTRNRLWRKAFMVSPAGFEPATPGLEDPHSGVYEVSPMRYNPCISTYPGSRSIYTVAPQTPVPWLRGDAVVTDRYWSHVVFRSSAATSWELASKLCKLRTAFPGDPAVPLLEAR